MKNKSILGINYSGFHDTSIVLSDISGKIIFAISLERVTRVKKDARLPDVLLKNIKFENISDIVISSNQYIDKKEFISKIHPNKLSHTRLKYSHQVEFEDFIKLLPNAELHFVDHELSHTLSAFWNSGFEEAICLTYDGGMANNNIFGGIYFCSKSEGCKLLDGFDVDNYAKITTLYTRITGILGFKEVHHEGKITGLAAFGKVNNNCLNILENWFINKFDELSNMSELIFSYSKNYNPTIYSHQDKSKELRNDLKEFSNETIAASLQYYTEQHIIKILDNGNNEGWLKKNICLSGGLFANVKLNQKIAEFKNFEFDNIFIAPAMGDEGTALGAIYNLLNTKYNIINFCNDMFLGNNYSKDEILNEVINSNLNYKILENPAIDLSTILASGMEIAYFEGKSEFGPRALGHRSILASASDNSVNNKLNKKLNRTEFMPFAPMTLEEHINDSYINIKNKKLAMQYMTISCECTEEMKIKHPAVVHIDNTARPQIISKNNGLLYDIMQEYYNKTSLSSIVNTSFNIHEEPIVNTPQDAIKGFLISELSYLYFADANILIEYNENKEIALQYMSSRLKVKGFNNKQQEALINNFATRSNINFRVLNEKEDEIQLQSKSLFEKEEVIQNLLKIKNEYEELQQNIYIKILKKLELIK